MSPFFYFSSSFTLVSHTRYTNSFLIPADYGNETDDDDGNDDNRKTDDENAATNSLQQNNENESHVEKVESTEPIPVAVAPTNNNNIDEQITTNEIITTIETSEAPIKTQKEVSTADDTCDVNNGGCDHICTIVPDEEIGGNVVECSCREGFYLDSAEGKKCSGEFITFSH